MIFDRSAMWILPEYKRKSSNGLSMLLHARCEQCPRRCSISSSIPSGFPSAYVDRLADVFSSLCAMQEEANPFPPDDGLQNPSSDASEV